jgi:hypothetical protein
MFKIEKDKLCNDCKWRKQYKICLKCSHPNKNMTSTDEYLGRGKYISLAAYNKCDCGGWEKNK